MNTNPANRWRRHVRPKDAIGVAQLAALATTQVMTVTEQFHLAILVATGITPESSLGWFHRGTQLVYAGLKLTPKAAELILQPIAKNLARHDSNDSRGRIQTLAAMNGVLGDQLALSHNPLATRFELFTPPQPSTQLPTQAAPQHHIIFLHGLCMDEFAWQQSDLLAQLSNEKTLISFLRYNSGLPIRQNAELMVDLLAQLEKPGLSFSLVGHSMGGLIAHQAWHIAASQKREFLSTINKIICIGSPHLGAPMAKLGHWLEETLHSNTITRPFTYLTKLRSVGIKDLQHGFYSDLTSADTEFYCLAGELPAKLAGVKEQLGDGLVPESSALGLPQAHHCVIENVSHLGLLTDPRVMDEIVQWLQPQR